MEEKIIDLKNGRKLELLIPTEPWAEQLLTYLRDIFIETDNHVFGGDDFNFTVEKIKKKIRSTTANMGALMIIGVVDNSIVSYGEFHGYEEKALCHNGALSISVKKEFWHRGIATAMMKELISFAKNNNIINLNIEVKGDNQRAIELYKHFGFEIIGVHKNTYNINSDYFDEVLMDLNLG